MEFKLTKHQVARTAKPDAEANDKMYVFKASSSLRTTYQIRMLLYKALLDNKKLELHVSSGCVISKDLKSLIAMHRKNIQVVRR